MTVTDPTGNNHHASIYFGDPAFIDATLQLYSWYKRFVIDGARQHELPTKYKYVDAMRCTALGECRKAPLTRS